MVQDKDFKAAADDATVDLGDGGSVGKEEVPAAKKNNLVRPVGIGLLLLTAIVVARLTGVTKYISLDNLGRLRDWINGFGALAPIIFIAIYVVAVVAFLPATPLTLLSGLIFGAVWGTLWTWIGTTIGAPWLFSSAGTRPGAWGLVENWTANDERVQKLDRGVLEPSAATDRGRRVRRQLRHRLAEDRLDGCRYNAEN